MKLNLNTVLLLLGGLATIGPDLTGMAAWLSNIHVGWVTHVVHVLGYAATACGALALALPKLRAFLAALGLATAPGQLVPGAPVLPASPPAAGVASEAPTPVIGNPIVRKKDKGGFESLTWAIIAIALIGTLLCLWLIVRPGVARADTPTSPQLGGCVATGSVCFGTAADVVLTKIGLSAGNKGISGGFSTGVGYGVTVAPDKFYATGLDLFLNVDLSGSSTLASRVSPALMLHAMNYLFFGVTMDITAPTDTTGSYGTGWSLLLGFGSTITSITPGYARQEAARQMAAERVKATQP